MHIYYVIMRIFNTNFKEIYSYSLMKIVHFCKSFEPMGSIKNRSIYIPVYFYHSM